MDFNIKEELQKLPHAPGVYLMRDKEDTIMYVGKAIDLHNRVRSYFGTHIAGRGPQITQMVRLVVRFEYIVTDSELEALILENNLIKENRPRYNTLLKDDKTYPFIKVTLGEPYPRIQFSRTMRKDKSKYFGPFPSAQAVRKTIDLVNRLCGLRTCNRVLPRDIGKDRPCLDYHMKLCCAPCAAGTVTQEEYRARVEKAVAFLNGDYRDTVRELKQKMEEASASLAFEDAARYRDLLTGVETVMQKQTMTDRSMEDRDLIAVATDQEDAVVQVFFVREGKIVGREHFFMRVRGENNTEPAIVTEFIKQFYSGTPLLPRELVVPCKPEEQTLLETWLTGRRGSRVSIRIPERGQVKKLMKLATENANLVLSRDRERLKREEGRTIGAVREIAALLGLKNVSRMEAFDISNTSGFANVGSMVVFEQGKAKKSDYRKFRIREVAGPDDYACMQEVLTRRFRHGRDEKQPPDTEQKDSAYESFTRFPDLNLMDGGKGQVNVALEVLRTLHLNIPVCGMVKDDRHRTRGLYFNNREIPVDTRSDGFQLITRIQDEAHRFAIEYHRSLRGKAQTESVLDSIPGIGKARRKALMRRFRSMEEIREADVDTLAQVPGIPFKEAKAIYAFFHEGETRTTP